METEHANNTKKNTSSYYLDQPSKIREDEELDYDRLYAFLKEAIPGLRGELTVQQFPSGNSNLTYLLKFANRELVLRRPPFGRKAKSAHDMSREYKVLRALKPHFRYCPEALVYSEDESVIGCPFVIMERLSGIILRKDLPSGLSFTPSQARQLTEHFIEALAELHSINYQEVGLADLGKPDGYVQRQVKGWCSRYRDARTDDVPGFEDVMQWLVEKMPPQNNRVSLLHNDFKLDNLVLDPQDPLRIIGILDWEMATLGDPLMDLGFSLGYWVQADDPEHHQLIRTNPTHLQGMLTRKEQVEFYAKKTEQKIDNFDFYYCFGVFRVAVIAQQIYYRYYHGQTRDERFSRFGKSVEAFEKIVLQHIEESSL